MLRSCKVLRAGLFLGCDGLWRLWCEHVVCWSAGEPERYVFGIRPGVRYNPLRRLGRNESSDEVVDGVERGTLVPE